MEELAPPSSIKVATVWHHHRPPSRRQIAHTPGRGQHHEPDVDNRRSAAPTTRARRETAVSTRPPRTRCTRSSHPHHVALARYYDPTIGRFTAVDPIVDPDQPGSLDRFGYGLASPVTLSDPSGLRVPVGTGSDPDSGGSYDAGRRPMIAQSTGRQTRLRMPGEGYADTRGVRVRYAAASGSGGVTAYAMARRLFRENNPWEMGEEFGRVDNLGAYDSCSVGLEGCQWRSLFLTWDTIRGAGRDEAEYNENTVRHFPSDHEFLRAISNGSAILAIAAAITPLAPASPYLAGLSAVTAVGAEAMDENSPCRGQRVLAAAGWEMATGAFGGAISEAGSAAGGTIIDVGSQAWSPSSQVTC